MARKLNTNFLTILLLVVIGVAVALFLAERFLIHESPKHYIDLGNQAMHDHNWNEAVSDYAKATRLNPKDAKLQTMLGAALANIVQTNPEATRMELGAYNQALEIDPNYLPALTALSDFWTQVASQNQDADSYTSAVKYSKEAYAADPTNEKMQTRADELVLQEWANGLDANQSDVDQAVKELKSLWQKNPADGELPFWIATTEVQQGVRIARQDTEGVEADVVAGHYKNAVAIFESVLNDPKGGSGAGPQAKNASMHYFFARLLGQLSTLDFPNPDENKKYQDRCAAEIKIACDLVKQGDTDYVAINQFAADTDMRRNDIDGAISIYKKMPDSLPKDIAMAEVMSRSPDPAKHEEVVQSLKTAIGSLVDDPNHIQFMSARFLLMMELAKVQVQQYAEMPASPEKKQLHDTLKDTLNILSQVAGTRVYYPIDDAQAEFQISSGGEDEMTAVQMLNKLMTDNPPSKKDYYWFRLESMLAQGYEDTNQASNAVAIMRDVVQAFPREVPPRRHLISLLLTEHPEEAPEQVTQLEKLSPEDPMLNVFKIEILMSTPSSNNDPDVARQEEKDRTDAINKIYSKLHEDRPSQMSAKARIAFRIKNFDEAERLLRLSLSKDPSQVADWVMLSEMLSMEKKTDQALDVANKGLAATNDSHLKLLIPMIKGESQKALDDLQEQLAKENPDKSQGDVTLAQLAAKRGDLDAEGADLMAADKAAPNNPKVQDLLFNYYLQTKQFDKAGACITILARFDADHASGQLYSLALAEAQHDTATAESIANQLTKDKPEFARSWLAMGDVLQNEGRYQEAITNYRICLDKESNLVEAYIGLVHCFYGLHRADDAMQTINEGLTRLPDNEVLAEMKLAHNLNYGKPQDAYAELKAELEKQPRPDLYAALADVAVRYSETLRNNHQDDDAKKEAEMAIHALQSPLDVLKQWPDEKSLYLAMSQCQLAAGRAQDAVNTLIAWSQRDAWKNQPDPYMAISETLEGLNIHDEAEKYMYTALQESGYQLEYQIRMASLLSLHKKYDEALKLLRSTNADAPEVREKVIQILLVAGRFDDAQNELASDVAKSPANAEQLLTIWSLALFEHHDFKGSIDKATQAIALGPNDPTALFCRARARLQLAPPDAAGAVEDLQLVRQNSPGKVEVRIALADAYLILNQADDAAGQLRDGLQIDPGNKPMRMKLVDIYVNGPHPRLNEALKTLQEVETVTPFDHDPDIFENEAMVLSKLHQADAALGKSEIALKLAPTSAEVVRTNFQVLNEQKDYQGIIDHYNAMDPKLKTLSWALWDLAGAEHQLGSDQALPDMLRALSAAQSEDDPRELDAIAGALAHQYSYDQAINALLPMSKTYVSAEITLARTYQDHGDDTSALQTIDALMTGADKLSRRDQINLYTNAAIMYQLAKPTAMPDKAYAAYQAWLKLDPENLEALNNMACLLADNFPPARAGEGLQYANEAVDEMVRLGRTEPRLLDTQAWLQILNGNAMDGIHTLNTIMDGFATFPDEYLHIGEGYMRLDMPDPVQAEAQGKLGLEMVMKRNGGDEDAGLRGRLQDLITRADAKRKEKPQQAQVP